MADLVEADDHVAGGIESRDARPLLVAVDPDAIVARKLGADHLRQLRVRVGAERRIDAVEGVMPFGRVTTMVPVDRHRLPGPSTHSIPASFSFGCLPASGEGPCRCDQRNVGGVAPDEDRLGHAVTVAPITPTRLSVTS